MKSLIKISNLNNSDDVLNIKEIVAQNSGVIACEVSITKKELSVVYDDLALSITKIVEELEENGYIVE